MAKTAKRRQELFVIIIFGKQHRIITDFVALSHSVELASSALLSLLHRLRVFRRDAQQILQHPSHQPNEGIPARCLGCVLRLRPERLVRWPTNFWSYLGTSASHLPHLPLGVFVRGVMRLETFARDNNSESSWVSSCVCSDWKNLGL